MGLRFYFSKATIPIYCAYECPHCKKLTYCAEKISAYSTLSGTGGPKYVREKYYDLVGKQSKSRLAQKVELIVHEAFQRKYRTAQFKGCCIHCEYQSPWQKLRYGLFDIIFLYAPLSLSSICIVGLLDEIWLPPVLTAIISAITALSYWLIRNSHRNSLETEIANLPTESLPSFFFTENDLFNYLEKNNFGALADCENLSKDNKYCKKCGANITNDVNECHVCREKL